MPPRISGILASGGLNVPTMVHKLKYTCSMDVWSRRQSGFEISPLRFEIGGVLVNPGGLVFVTDEETTSYEK